MQTPQNTAERLFHLQALISRKLSDVAKALEMRAEVKQKSLTPWTGISRWIGEDIFNNRVDQTDFDGEVALDTNAGVPFSFSIRLRYETRTWTIEAEVSEIEEFGGTDRCRFPELSSTNLEEISAAAMAACEWLTARATDFDFKTRPSESSH